MISFKHFFRLQLVTMIAVTLFGFNSAHAAMCTNAIPTDRPRIGLVLGGGGARGAAHIGVIRMLEELRVPVDYISGTSMGALVGGLYATGMTADEMEEVVLNMDWADLFDDNTERQDRPFRRKRDDLLDLSGPKLGIGKDASLLPKGAFGGQKISFLLETLTASRVQQRDFDRLPIPYRAVAADIITGREVVLRDGDLGQAMRSSMSLPGIFDPVEREGALLVDGGIVNNVPVDVARAMGAERLIVVSVGTPLAGEEELSNLLAILNQLSGLMVMNNTRAQLATLTAEDILLEPELGDKVSSADFAKVDVAVPLGYSAAEKFRDRIAELGVSQNEYDAHRRQVESCVAGEPVIEFVRLDNRSRIADKVIREMLNIETGKPLDAVKLERDIKQVYALGFLKLVHYEILEEEGRTGMVIRVRQDERGTQFVETGLHISGNEKSNSFNLRAGYLNTGIDELGTEFRAFVQIGEDPGLFAELYKPTNRRLRTIFLPSIAAESKEFGQFDENGNKLAEFQVREYSGTLALAREFGRHALLSAGVRYLGGSVDVDIGDPALGEFNFTGGEYFVSAQYDRLDNLYLPTHGSRFELKYVNSQDSLGADAEFEQITGSAVIAHSWGPHSLLGRIFYNTTLDDNAPIYARFRAGGFLRMSGFNENELSGQHVGVGIVSYRYELGKTGFLPAYVGGTVEYGNVAEKRSRVFSDGILNGSVYFGYDSPLGPLYAGIGFAEDRSGVFFLRLGNVLGRSSIVR